MHLRNRFGHEVSSMNHYKNALKMTALGLTLAAGQAMAHGNVTPQSVDTKGLEELGTEWRETNPYRATTLRRGTR